MIGVKSAVVGRERVLAELGELLAAARVGSGSVVLLTGEAGIGKSTVADVLLDRARAEGVPVLVGRAVADEGALRRTTAWLHGGIAPSAVVEPADDRFPVRQLDVVAGPHRVGMQPVEGQCALTQSPCRGVAGGEGIRVVARSRRRVAVMCDRPWGALWCGPGM